MNSERNEAGPSTGMLGTAQQLPMTLPSAPPMESNESLQLVTEIFNQNIMKWSEISFLESMESLNNYYPDGTLPPMLIQSYAQPEVYETSAGNTIGVPVADSGIEEIDLLTPQTLQTFERYINAALPQMVNNYLQKERSGSTATDAPPIQNKTVVPPQEHTVTSVLPDMVDYFRREGSICVSIKSNTLRDENKVMPQTDGIENCISAAIPEMVAYLRKEGSVCVSIESETLQNVSALPAEASAQQCTPPPEKESNCARHTNSVCVLTKPQSTQNISRAAHQTTTLLHRMNDALPHILSNYSSDENADSVPVETKPETDDSKLPLKFTAFLQWVKATLPVMADVYLRQKRSFYVPIDPTPVKGDTSEPSQSAALTECINAAIPEIVDYVCKEGSVCVSIESQSMSDENSAKPDSETIKEYIATLPQTIDNTAQNSVCLSTKMEPLNYVSRVPRQSSANEKCTPVPDRVENFSWENSNKSEPIKDVSSDSPQSAALKQCITAAIPEMMEYLRNAGSVCVSIASKQMPEDNRIPPQGAAAEQSFATPQCPEIVHDYMRGKDLAGGSTKAKTISDGYGSAPQSVAPPSATKHLPTDYFVLQAIGVPRAHVTPSPAKADDTPNLDIRMQHVLGTFQEEPLQPPMAEKSLLLPQPKNYARYATHQQPPHYAENALQTEDTKSTEPQKHENTADSSHQFLHNVIGFDIGRPSRPPPKVVTAPRHAFDLHIDRSPINCPQSDCRRMLFVSDLCKHFHYDHCNVPLERIGTCETKHFVLDSRLARHNIIKCHMCYLIKDMLTDLGSSKFKDFLPIFVMCSRIKLSDIYGIAPLGPKDEDLVMVWVTGLEPSKEPIYVTLTSWSREGIQQACLTENTTRIYPIREPANALNVYDSGKALVLTETDVNQLTGNGDTMLEFQLFVH